MRSSATIRENATIAAAAAAESRRPDELDYARASPALEIITISKVSDTQDKFLSLLVAD